MESFRFSSRRRSISAASFALFILALFLLPLICLGIRSFPSETGSVEGLFGFTKAPEYRNGVDCPASTSKDGESMVHVAMTLDSEYLRGSMADVHSVLRHASCPENVSFHFIAAEFDSASPRVLIRLVHSIFPSLNFKVYIFREDTVYPLLGAMTFVTTMCVFSLTRNAIQNPAVRINKTDRKTAVLENYEEGEKYVDHGFRKFLKTQSRQIFPSPK